MSEAHENLDRQAPTPETGVEELRRQLETARQELEMERARVAQMETHLEAEREKFGKEVAALETHLQNRETQHEDARGKLNEKTTELEALKARRFKPNDLAKLGIGLFILLAGGAGVLSYFILNTTGTWWQACAVLGLYLFCCAFAAVSMRLLADRCK